MKTMMTKKGPWMSAGAYQWAILLMGSFVWSDGWAAAPEGPAEPYQQLLRRIEQLEGEVRSLRQANPPSVQVTTNHNAIRLEELEQKIKVVERKNELAAEVAQEKARTTAVVTAGPRGFQIRSADTNFVLNLRGYLQADARYYPGDHTAGTANDTFLLRRVRPIFEGTVFGKYDFRLLLDFASGVNSAPGNNSFVPDAYINARLWPEFQVRVGKFKAPVGLERLQSAANLEFVGLGFPTQLVPNRDTGLQVHGALFNERLTYQLAVLNGSADGGSSDQEIADNGKEFAGRLFATPFTTSSVAGLRGLGVGVAGTFGGQSGAVRSYTTPGQQRFFAYRTGTGLGTASPNVVADGDHWRISPQGYYYWGSFGLLGEYVISEQQVRRDNGTSIHGTFRNTGWQVIGSYILTGEDNSFGVLTPRSPFGVGEAGWGAWELVARVGALETDKSAFPLFADPVASGTGVFSWGVGVNWHLNRNIKLSLDFEHSTFEQAPHTSPSPTGAVVSPLLRNGENILFSRAQLSF